MSSYGISSVKYDSDRKYITEAKIHLSDGTLFFTSDIKWKRQDMLRALGFSDLLVTVVSAPGNRLQKDADVHGVTVDGAMYFRLDKQLLAADDLGQLFEG